MNSVACLERVWVDFGSDACALADVYALLLFETQFAKEARNRSGCRGKPLDCSIKVICWGLQCGLSGNQALQSGNAATVFLKGNRRSGDITVNTGENLPDLSRKIYSTYCHRSEERRVG